MFLNEIPSRAADGALTLVLFDEVESIAVSRSAASLETNPADVHRATDAVLTGIDTLTKEHRHIVAIATSNFPTPLIPRCALAAQMSSSTCPSLPLTRLRRSSPRPWARWPTRSLRSTRSAARPSPRRDREDHHRRGRAPSAKTRDRRVRRVRDETVVDPGRLTFGDLDAAAADLSAQLTPAKARRAAA